MSTENCKERKLRAFLMDDWPLVEKLIKELDEHLDVPVTAKD